MPAINGVQFPYTPQGMQAAQTYQEALEWAAMNQRRLREVELRRAAQHRMAAERNMAASAAMQEQAPIVRVLPRFPGY